MKGIVYSIIVYMVAIFLYKLCGDLESNIHTNYYWLVSTIIFSFIFFKMSFLLNINYFKEKYFPEDISLYKWILRMFSLYWAIMFIVRVYLAFNIDDYENIVENPYLRNIPIGALVLAVIYLLLIFKVVLSNDTKKQR